MNMKGKSNLTRAIRLATAKAISPQALAMVEDEVAREIVGPDVMARDAYLRQMSHAEHLDMTAFQATEEFAGALSSRLQSFALTIGATVPKAANYDLRFATPVMFKGVWVGRQIADELCMPYGYFIDAAVRYWSERGGKRLPRVTQLCAPDVLGHVMACWADDSKTTIS